MAVTLKFEIDDVDPAFLTPFSIKGTEALSTLYTFDVSCTAESDRLLGTDIMGRRAVLTLVPDNGGAARTMPGIVSRLDILPPTSRSEVHYRIQIQPWLSRLTLSRHNHVFGTDSPVAATDVIERELKGAARKGSLADEAGPRNMQHEMRLTKKYPTFNQILQYEETNFAFVSRLAEHWGLYYYFEVSSGVEKVVFVDANISMPLLEHGHLLEWQPFIAGTNVTVSDTIFGLDARYEPVSARIFLRDYNEKLPHVPLVVSHPIDPASHGHWVEYGLHYRTPSEGEFLAKVRSEEQLCRRVRFTGRSTAPGLAPGRVFTLAGHPYRAWNQRYLLVSVTHSARVDHPAIAAANNEPGYANEFTAIPLDVQFRPERVTPKPRVDGLLNGRVEGPPKLPISHPSLDENGYYRVRLPTDMSDSPSGQASQWVRKAEPYGGPSNGMHFPLPVGTDVVVACVNGDPDRPVILGAVPAADNQSVVHSNNQRLNRIQTRSGVQLTLADTPVPTIG